MNFGGDSDGHTKVCRGTVERAMLTRKPTQAADEKAFVDAVVRAANALIREEPEITRMDNIAGDGDCGLTLKGGAEGIFVIIKC